MAPCSDTHLLPGDIFGCHPTLAPAAKRRYPVAGDIIGVVYWGELNRVPGTGTGRDHLRSSGHKLYSYLCALTVEDLYRCLHILEGYFRGIEDEQVEPDDIDIFCVLDFSE